MTKSRLSTTLLIVGLLVGASQITAQSSSSGAKILAWVELHEPPATSFQATSSRELSPKALTQATRQHLARLDQNQQNLLPRLTTAPIEAQVLYRLKRVLNGIAIQVAEHHLDRITAWPEVASAQRITPKQRSTSTSVPFVDIPTLWDPLGLDLTGAGLSIGIVDTGVDYLHTDFGGSGLTADYLANNPTTLADGFFPSAKVVGGFDFVGDAYDASVPAQSIPVPDPDPMDCDGHGTHVAGIAAGLGVASDGSTYAGSYEPGTDFAGLRIGPGVAPEADIYALRVFGCTGTTAVVDQAIEWAVDPNDDGDFSDHLDILNLSLTAPFSNGDDPTAIAANNAVLAGVVVVAASGNDGQVHFVTGSPAAADRAVSVALHWDDDLQGGGLRVTSPASISGTHQAGGAAFGPSLTSPGVTGELVLADPRDACGILTNGADISGKIALADLTDDCTPVTQARNAQNAGATALVLINNVPSLGFLPNDGTGGDITITTALIRDLAGASLESQLPGLVTVELETVLLGDMFASFSSRGPRRASPEMALKPDLAAPGVAIASAGLGDGTNGGTSRAFLSGTSMATPHVSGLMALLKELHPTWTPQQLKALAMNTTRSVFFEPEQTPPILPPTYMGAGRIDALAASEAEVIAYQREKPELVGLSFGHHEVTSAAMASEFVRIENLSASAATYTLSMMTLTDLPGVEFSLPGGTTVIVPAAETRDIEIRADLDPSLLEHVRTSTLEPILGLDPHWLSEETALLLLTPTAGVETVTLRVPLHISARPAAQMAGVSPLALGAALSGSIDLDLSGQGVMNGTTSPSAITSRVTPLELQQSLEPPIGEARRSHLAEIGLGSDFAAQPSLDETTLYFGLVSHGVGSTPHNVRHEILIDVDQNGIDDFLLTQGDRAEIFGLLSDDHVAELIDLTSQLTVAQEPLEGFLASERSSTLLLNETMLLPVRAADLGLSPGSSRFRYRVRSFDQESESGMATGPLTTKAPLSESPISESNVLTFDPAAPGLDGAAGLPGLLTRDSLPGDQLTIDFDLDNLVDNLSQGLLLIHHHNLPGQRAQIVKLSSSQLPDLDLSVGADPSPVPAGDLLTYTVTVTNLSTSLAAADVTATVLLPVDTSFSDASMGCAENAGTVLCSFGDLAASTNAQRQIEVQVDRPLPVAHQLEIEADVSSATLDPELTNNSTLLPTLITDILFQDGFESADTTAWTRDVP